MVDANALAAALVRPGGWTARNPLRYGWPRWETSASIGHAYAYGLAHPALLIFALLGKLPRFLLLFAVCGLASHPGLRRSLQRLREEEPGAL